MATAAMASTKVSSRSRSRDRSVEGSVVATADTLGRRVGPAGVPLADS